jgi:hypothetical protein
MRSNLPLLALVVERPWLPAPENQSADGIGEAGARDAIAFAFETRRRLVVGRQNDLERSAVSDLGVELARRTESEHCLVTGVLLEGRSDLLHRRCEI